MEAAAVGFGHPDHFADHGDRDRQRVVILQVYALSGLHPVEQFAGDLLGAVGQPGDGFGREGAADQSAQPHVLRVVLEDHAVGAHELERLGDGQRFGALHDTAEPVVGGEVDAVAVAGQEVDVPVGHV